MTEGIWTRLIACIGAGEGKNIRGFGGKPENLGVDGWNAVQGDYQEIGWECMHWIHLPEDRNEWWDCVGMLLNSGSTY
jgi:hypothetical protein